MDKNLVFKAFIFPAIAAVVIGAALFAVLNNGINSFLPIENGSAALEFDSTSLPDDKAEENKLEKNSLLGTIGNTELRYNADYSALKSSASVSPNGVLPDEKGCTYIEMGAQNALELEKVITLNGKRFTLEEEKTVDNINMVYATVPRAEKSLVVYYNEARGVGLTSKYKTLVYKEAE